MGCVEDTNNIINRITNLNEDISQLKIINLENDEIVNLKFDSVLRENIDKHKWIFCNQSCKEYSELTEQFLNVYIMNLHHIDVNKQDITYKNDDYLDNTIMNLCIYKTYKNGLINTFSKIDNETYNLHIIKKEKTENDLELDVLIDAKYVNEIMKKAWSPVKPNKSKSYYIRHSATKNDEHDYLHRFVVKLYEVEPSSEEEYSIDHINRDPLDNRINNLRWASHKTQNENQDKRARRVDAKKSLPNGIHADDLLKYVEYGTENLGNDKMREYFYIKKLSWCSSKSNNIQPEYKLAEAYAKIMENPDVFEQPKHIPPYIQTILDTTNFNVKIQDEDFALKKHMIPTYVIFQKQTEKRAHKFKIEVRDENRKIVKIPSGNIKLASCGSANVSLQTKYEEILKCYKVWLSHYPNTTSQLIDKFNEILKYYHDNYNMSDDMKNWYDENNILI